MWELKKQKHLQRWAIFAHLAEFLSLSVKMYTLSKNTNFEKRNPCFDSPDKARFSMGRDGYRTNLTLVFRFSISY